MVELTYDQERSAQLDIVAAENETIARLKTDRAIIEENFLYMTNKDGGIPEKLLVKLKSSYLDNHREEPVSRTFREGYRMAVYGDPVEDILTFYTGLESVDRSQEGRMKSLNDFLQGLQLGDFKTGDGVFGEFVDLLADQS